MAKVCIGISGWRYAPWRGKFYPGTLCRKDELSFAAQQFPTIEINGTFYSLQSPDSFAAWHDAVPETFVFAVKGPRYITHMRRLRDVARLCLPCGNQAAGAGPQGSGTLGDDDDQPASDQGRLTRSQANGGFTFVEDVATQKPTILRPPATPDLRAHYYGGTRRQVPPFFSAKRD